MSKDKDVNTAELDVGREALSSLTAKLTMSVFGFVSILVFARVLGPAGVGRYYIAYTISLILIRISAGVGQAVKKRVSEVDEAPHEYLGVGILFHVAFLGVGGGLIWVLYGFTDLITQADVAAAVFAVFATEGLFQILNRFYQGLGHPGESFWIDTFRSVLTTVFQLALLFAGMEAFGLLVGIALATVVCVVILLIRAGVRPALPSRRAIDRIAEFARWSVGTSIVSNAYSRLDVIVLGWLVGDAAVGFYETALRLVTPATQVAGSISTSINVKASGKSSLGEDVLGDVSNAISYTGLFAIPIFFGALALPRPLMQTFFSGAFAEGGPALVGIAAFTAINVFNQPLIAVIEGTNRPRDVFRVQSLVFALNVPMAVLFTNWFGLLGVVAATFLSEFVMFLMYEYNTVETFGEYVFPRPVFEQLASGAVMCGVILLLRNVVSLREWPAVIAVVAFGACVYFATITVISSHFRLTVRNVAGPLLS
ncbi:oligosaccharide flippase family protein [Haloferax marisrubri]|uniref:Polysaccharide biosynthesis protein n=1 Tax=Haloferax marisrubri TaxID=1544719 RepID=A0A2P4NP89_9EURY|nr:oligosaccharide flippase family protein [Haloferax marisrubri]POG54944.1 polysaccharide biosynthesis protein [Haloferax marisrubri]